MSISCEPRCLVVAEFGGRYACGLHLKYFDWQALTSHLCQLPFDECQSHIDSLLDLTVNHPHLIKYPLKSSYRRAFLKQLINKIEECEITHEHIYVKLIEVLATENCSEDNYHYKHFVIGDRYISLRESVSAVSQGTTGLCTWQAGVALANWGLRHKEILSNRKVLELGSGSGLTGLALVYSNISLSSYIFSDCHPAVLKQLEYNINLNNPRSRTDSLKTLLETNIKILSLNWEDVGHTNFDPQFKPEVILAAVFMEEYDHVCHPEGHRTGRKRPGKHCKIDKGTTSKYFKRVSYQDKKWIPPRSPYSLIQEDLYACPWQLLIATIFLTKTSAQKAIPRIHKFLSKWPTPQKLLEADKSDVSFIISPLGLGNLRTETIFRFTKEYLTSDWTYPIELHGIGKYGDDSFRIFCVNEWREVTPDDIPLTMYRNWLLENSGALGL